MIYTERERKRERERERERKRERERLTETEVELRQAKNKYSLKIVIDIFNLHCVHKITCCLHSAQALQKCLVSIQRDT